MKDRGTISWHRFTPSHGHHAGASAVLNWTVRRTDDTAQPAMQRDPDEWKTRAEPMTDAQRFYLETLCRETGEEFDDSPAEGPKHRSGSMNSANDRHIRERVIQLEDELVRKQRR